MRAAPIAMTIVALSGVELGRRILVGRTRTIRTRGVVIDGVAGPSPTADAAGRLAT
jgi:hypothetical protein